MSAGKLGSCRPTRTREDWDGGKGSPTCLHLRPAKVAVLLKVPGPCCVTQAGGSPSLGLSFPADKRLPSWGSTVSLIAMQGRMGEKVKDSFPMWGGARPGDGLSPSQTLSEFLLGSTKGPARTAFQELGQVRKAAFIWQM